jgi:hypothetical protein
LHLTRFWHNIRKQIDMMPPVFTAIVVLVSSIFAKPADDAAKMAELFKKADAETIAASFSPSLQLTTPGKQGVYSKSQAKMILSDFFSTNTPSAAKVSQQGKSENGAHFLVISLTTSTQEFKTTLFYRGSGAGMRIHELKIEK